MLVACSGVGKDGATRRRDLCLTSQSFHRKEIHRKLSKLQEDSGDLLTMALKIMIVNQNCFLGEIMTIKNMLDSLKRTNTGSFVNAEGDKF